ncbi:MAG: SpoIIE family protein phosphatase [Bacteroidales bacterium]|nr:SpoIIE family protein phosphatase [Bacteroidales bacterium]
MGIVVIAAILVETISIVQFRRIHSIMEVEMDTRSHMALLSMQDRIGHMLDMTEGTMRENMLYLKFRLNDPDSIFRAMEYLIDDNPDVVGGGICFVPYYFPEKGRLYEPYAYKDGDTIYVEQIAGEDHDYTQNPFYIKVVESGRPDWSDPYLFETDSTRCLTSYSYPIKDEKGRVIAVCDLNVDVSWMGESLNAHQHFPSSFGMILTKDGRLVAGPPPSRASASMVEQAMELLRDEEESTFSSEMSVKTIRMKRDPYWQIAQVFKKDEVFADMRRMGLQQLLFILLGLAILFFMVNRFARSEKKLRDASERQARINGELEVARKIQREMLPESFPDGIYGLLEPAREVGGDLFDFYRRDGKLFFCIGDVSGKGVPSAMLMSVIHSLFRMVSQRIESPSGILKILNEQLCQGNDTNMFVTFFVGTIDYYTGRLRYANAGHDKPFLLSEGVSLLPAKSNLPLGVFPETIFEEQTLQLSPGCSLFLYTDGLTEAKHSGKQLFGRSRVQARLQEALSSGLDARQTVVSVFDEVRGFMGDAAQRDDLTMLLVQYNPSELVREHIDLKNHQEELSRLSDFLKGFCARVSLEQKLGLSLRLAAEEAVVNAISYAYPEGKEGIVSVYADSDRREVRFTIVDSGVPFDPTAVVPGDTRLDAQERPIGGLGILLTRKIMDSVSYSRKEGKNVLTLTKNIV